MKVVQSGYLQAGIANKLPLQNKPPDPAAGLGGENTA